MDEKFSSLSKDVEQIKNNTNAFGSKIKLPGNDGKNTEEVNALELIIKGIAASLFGAKLTSDNEGTIKSLFDPKKSTLQNIAENINKFDDGIFGKINSIEKTLKSFETVLSEGIKVSINNNLEEKLNGIEGILKDGIKVSMIDTKETVTLDLDLNLVEDQLQYKFDKIFENENLYKPFYKNIQTSAEHALLNTPLIISDESYNEIKKKFNNIININQISETLKNIQLDPLSLDIQINLDEDSYNETKKKISKILGSPEDIKNNVSKISGILNNTEVKNSINDIFKSINEIDINLNNEKLKQLSYLSTFLSSLVSILDSSKINDGAEENFKIINNLLKDNGPLATIFENLNKEPYTKAIDGNIKKNLDISRVLFESLLKLIDIKFGDIKKSEKTLRYINRDFFRHIENVISNINKLDKYTNDINVYDHLQTLTEIINAIPSIASISIFAMLKSRISIKFLNHFIKNDLSKIFDSLEAVIKDKKASFDNVKQLSVCIDSILKLFELDNEKIENSEEHLEMLKDLISSNIQNVINAITKLSGVNESIKYIKDISENVIDSLNELLKSLPSISTLLKADIKLSLMSGEINLLYDLLTNKEFRLIKRKIEPDKILGTIKDSIKVVEQIKILNSNILSIELKGVLETLYVLDKEIVFIKSSFSQLGSLLEKFSEPMNFDNLNKTIENFNNTLNLLKASYNKEIQKIAGVNLILETFLELLYEYKLNDFSEKSEELSNFISNNMLVILEHFKKGSKLDDSLNNLMFINPKTIKILESVNTIIKKIALISNMKLLMKISEKGLEALEKSADKIIDIVNKFKDIKEEDLKGANKTITMLMKVIVGSAAILLFGSIMMYYINPLNLLMFVLALGGFITGVLKVYSKLSKDTLESSFSAAYDLALLIAISGATLIFGGLLFHLIDFKDLFGYTFSLAAFMFAIIGTYRLFNKQIKNTFSAAYDLGILIAISGGTLVFCSLIYRLVRWQDIKGFILALGSFMTMILGIYAFFNKWFKNTLRGTKDFAYLIIVSGGLMILGALLFDFAIKNFGRIFGFGLLLSLYVGMICLPWILGGHRMRKAMKNAKEFAYLVMVCAGVLILGPIIIDLWSKGNYWEGFGKILGFAVILGAFIIGIGVALKLAGRVKNLLPNAIALMAMVIISGAVLVAGPIILKTNNVEPEEVFKFAGILIGFTYLMGKALESLKEIKWNTIAKGIVTMGAILLITYLSSLVIEEIRNAVGDKHGEYWLQLVEGVTGIFLVIAAVGSGAAGIGTLLTGATFGIGAGVLAVGIAAILGIALAAYVSISVVGAIRTQMKEIGNIETVKDDVNSLMDIIVYTGEKIASAFGVRQLLKIKASVGAFKNIGEALSLIGQGVKDWSDLRIVSKYDKKGRPIEYISITSGLFKKAKDNIAKTVLALGEAIADVYDNAKDKKVFTDPTGIGLLDSPFAIIMKSLRYMGDGLTSTAKGIKQWSNLKFPVKFDKKGNPIEYESLVNADFTKLSGNIKLVLEALGNAIVNVVETDTNNIFDDGLLTKSKAAVAVQSIKVMGDVLNNTALAIACYASGKFPIFDKNGNIIRKQNGEIAYITKIDSTKISNAKERIKEVLIALGGAINEVVNGPNKTLFRDSIGTDAPAIVAAEAMSNMGNALNTMIDVIKKLNELKLEDIALNLEDVKSKISNLLNGTIGIMSLFMKPSENHEFIGSNNGRSGLSGLLKYIWSGDQTYADYINENLDNVNDATKVINTLVSSISLVIESIASLGKFLTENKNHLNYLANSENFIKMLNNVFSSINLINKSLFERIHVNVYSKTLKTTSTYENSNQQIIKIIDSIKKLFVNINEFIVDYNKNIKTYASFKNRNAHIQTISSTMSDLIAILNKYAGISDESYKNYKKFLSFLNDYSKSLNILIGSLNKFDKSFNPNLELLKSGIIGLYNITSTINDSNVEIFSQYVSDIQDFVESVEGIDLSKFNAMTSLIQALNELSGKVGNLDEFVDGLSEKLTAVLYELVTQLRKAEATINNAHELQNRRKILIDNSINKVKDIMSQHMVVEVLKGDETRNNPSLGGGGGNYSGGNSGTPTDNNKEDSLESPENASPLQPKDDAESVKAKSGWGADALTKESFVDIMNRNFKKWMDGQNGNS